MAAKLEVVLALFAVCHSSPVLIKGSVYHAGRGYSAYNFNYGARKAHAQVNEAHVQAQAQVNAQAYDSSNSRTQLARDGYNYPGQANAQAYGSFNGEAKLARDRYYSGHANAQAQIYDASKSPAYDATKAVAQAQDVAYYPDEQHFEILEVVYQVPGTTVISNGVSNCSVTSATSNGAGVAQSSAISNGVLDSSLTSTSSNGTGVAQSSAISNGVSDSSVTSTFSNDAGVAQSSAISNDMSDSSVTSATSNGAEIAQSSAETQGLDVTTSNTQTYDSGFEVANSTAISDNGSAITSAVTEDLGSTSFTTETVIVDAKTLHDSYISVVPTQSVAFIEANVIGSGTVGSFAEVIQNFGKTRRFDTLYDAPTTAQTQAVSLTDFDSKFKALAMLG